MRRSLVILCLVLNLSVLLMPFDTTHAHVSSSPGHSTDVHSGHNHDLGHGPNFDHRHDGGADRAGDQVLEQIVDLQASLSTQNTFQSTFWSDWLPLACMALLSVLAVQLCTLVFSRSPSDPKPSFRHGYWRPPLRGPPSFSI